MAGLNAIFGIIYAHAAYGDGPLPEQIPEIWPDSAPLSDPQADQYVLGSTETVISKTGIPRSISSRPPSCRCWIRCGVWVSPNRSSTFFQPALQVVVEAGYDRSIPFGDPTPAELIPTIDPVTFAIEFANGVVQGANNAFELVGTQLPDYPQLESLLDQAQAWSIQDIGVPYDQAVTELNDAFDPFTLFTSVEGPLGQDVQSLLDLTGVQQDILNPILGLLGTVGGIFTS